MAPRTALGLALALALAGAAGCVYSPKGSCDVASDCAAGERCEAGVCIASAAAGGDPVGVETTSFTPVRWSALDGAAGVTFSVDAIGADLAGDVVVAGAVDAPYGFDPGAVPTGAFVLKRDPAGAAVAVTSFPTFSHGRFRTAVLPGGDVLFAASAFQPTDVGTVLSCTPPAQGALVVGRLGADLAPVWARAVDGTGSAAPIAPVALAATGADDLVVAGTGRGDFGCAGGDTANASFVAALSGADGTCLWSRGLGTQTLSDVEARDDGAVAIAGVCTPSGASFDPGGGTTCTKGLFVAVLSGANGSTAWARTTAGAGTVTAARDLAIAPDGRATVVGDASGLVDFGGGAVDFGDREASFAATFDPALAFTGLVRPIEDPYAAEPDALLLSRCAYDRSGRLWIAGRYLGQPTLAGLRFSACRAPDCDAASFLARLETRPTPRVTSFLPLRAGPDADEAAYVDDLVLFATTGTVAHALRFTGVAGAGAPAWSSAGGDLGVITVAP
jgi:hypothetical protein